MMRSQRVGARARRLTEGDAGSMSNVGGGENTVVGSMERSVRRTIGTAAVAPVCFAIGLPSGRPNQTPMTCFSETPSAQASR